MHERQPERAAGPRSGTDKTVEFWYDFASAYSYVAASRIECLAEAAGLSIVWRPFLLGPIFAAQGLPTTPFHLFPAKGRYMQRDVERLCARYNLPFRAPSVLPRNSVLPAALGLLASSENWSPAFTLAVFRANFVLDRDIGSEDVMRDILEGLNQPAGRCIDHATSAEGRRELRSQTQKAMKLGVFGAPTFIVAGDLFWGSDRMEQALDWAVSPWLPQASPA
jgi:2-hydroxychromene-2-carboxylate isomerase